MNDKWPDGTPNGQYPFDATGAPAVGGNNLTYKAGDTKVKSVESTTTVGENTVTTYSLQNVTVPQKFILFIIKLQLLVLHTLERTT